MNPKKRKLWYECIDVFNKYNIKFDNEDIMSDIIDEVTRGFLDGRGSVDFLIKLKFPYKTLLQEPIQVESIKNIEEENYPEKIIIPSNDKEISKDSNELQDNLLIKKKGRKPNK